MTEISEEHKAMLAKIEQLRALGYNVQTSPDSFLTSEEQAQRNNQAVFRKVNVDVSAELAKRPRAELIALAQRMQQQADNAVQQANEAQALRSINDVVDSKRRKDMQDWKAWLNHPYEGQVNE